MSTKSITTVKFNGAIVVRQYSAFDGDPAGNGLEIFRFLKNEFNREKFVHQLDKVHFLTDEELISTLTEGHRVSSQIRDGILPYIQNAGNSYISLIDYHMGLPEWENVAWAYELDLDRDVLRVGVPIKNDADDTIHIALAGLWSLRGLTSEKEFVESLMPQPTPATLNKDDVMEALKYIRTRHHSTKLDSVNDRICNYMEANLSDFLDSVNVDQD